MTPLRCPNLMPLPKRHSRNALLLIVECHNAAPRFAFNPVNVNKPVDANPTNDIAELIVTDLRSGQRVRF